MLRNLFLFLSRQRWLRSHMERPGVAETLVRRFVAGRTLDEAVKVCRRLAGENILVTLDHLGENVTNDLEAAASLADYQDALLRLRQERLGELDGDGAAQPGTRLRSLRRGLPRWHPRGDRYGGERLR